VAGDVDWRDRATSDQLRDLAGHSGALFALRTDRGGLQMR
jgi:hypothetical protein